jgi:hypothetical protein
MGRGRICIILKRFIGVGCTVQSGRNLFKMRRRMRQRIGQNEAEAEAE